MSIKQIVNTLTGYLDEHLDVPIREGRDTFKVEFASDWVDDIQYIGRVFIQDDKAIRIGFETFFNDGGNTDPDAAIEFANEVMTWANSLESALNDKA